jgi:chaperonin cofactor prefoldin
MAPGKKKPRPRGRPDLSVAIRALREDIESLGVAVETLNRRDAANVRRFAELQVEIDRLKGVISAPLKHSKG